MLLLLLSLACRNGARRRGRQTPGVRSERATKVATASMSSSRGCQGTREQVEVSGRSYVAAAAKTGVSEGLEGRRKPPQPAPSTAEEEAYSAPVGQVRAENGPSWNPSSKITPPCQRVWLDSRDLSVSVRLSAWTRFSWRLQVGVGSFWQHLLHSEP